jgi:hypothetical protein
MCFFLYSQDSGLPESPEQVAEHVVDAKDALFHFLEPGV